MQADKAALHLKKVLAECESHVLGLVKLLRELPKDDLSAIVNYAGGRSCEEVSYVFQPLWEGVEAAAHGEDYVRAKWQSRTGPWCVFAIQRKWTSHERIHMEVKLLEKQRCRLETRAREESRSMARRWAKLHEPLGWVEVHICPEVEFSVLHLAQLNRPIEG